MILLKNILYNLINKIYMLIFKKKLTFGINQGEVFLNDYYKGLDEDHFEKEYDWNCREIVILKENIAFAWSSNDDFKMSLLKNYKKKLKQKKLEMEMVKGEKFP